jgi:nitrogen-specific signal transduction histidine kinase
MASAGHAKPAIVAHPAMEHLLRLLDGMADGISIVNRQDEIEYANPALEREFGPARGRSHSEYFENLKSSSSSIPRLRRPAGAAANLPGHHSTQAG